MQFYYDSPTTETARETARNGRRRRPGSDRHSPSDCVSAIGERSTYLLRISRDAGIGRVGVKHGARGYGTAGRIYDWSGGTVLKRKQKPRKACAAGSLMASLLTGSSRSARSVACFPSKINRKKTNTGTYIVMEEEKPVTVASIAKQCLAGQLVPTHAPWLGIEAMVWLFFVHFVARVAYTILVFQMNPAWLLWVEQCYLLQESL